MSRAFDVEGLDTIPEVLPEFDASLKARNRSPRTIQSYCEAALLLDEFLKGEGLPRRLRDIERPHVEAFVVDQLTRHRPATAAVRFRSLQQFFKWAKAGGEIATSPMADMTPPTVTAPLVPVVPSDQAARLLATCSGRTFEDYRDQAILSLFLDTGARLSEITNLSTTDVETGEDRRIFVTGKGRRQRWIPFGLATRKALRRYERARSMHELANLPNYWLGGRGKPLTQSGIGQIMRRRASAAGIPHLNPHKFRHTFAHEWLANGGNESDLMRLTGWRSREMLARYGASVADERAHAAYRQSSSPVDRILQSE